MRAWRSEPLVLESPLPLPVVRQRLIDGSTSYLRASFTYGGFGGFRVVGRVGNRAISLQAARIGVRNSWRPVLRGRLEAAGAGTRLVGKLGWHPAVKAFSAVWVGIAFGIFVVSTGFAAAAANPRALLFSLVPLGFVAFFVGLTALCIRLSRGEETYLRSWLIERLQTAESGVHGYRPWKAGG